MGLKKRKKKEYLDSYRVDKRFSKSLASRIFPVLGKYDKVVPFAKSETFWKKQGIRPGVYPYGHFTSIVKRLEIRKLILKLIN